MQLVPSSFTFTFMARLAVYWLRGLLAWKPIDAFWATKHWLGTPRKESLAFLTSMYRLVPAPTSASGHPTRRATGSQKADGLLGASGANPTILEVSNSGQLSHPCQAGRQR